MKILLFFFLLAGLVEAQVKSPVPENSYKPLITGVSYRDFTDSCRSNWLGTGPRPIRSVIWYPAGRGGKAETIIDSSQFLTPVTTFRDSRISSRKKKYPLVLISHGAQGNAQQMRWLGYYLASRGYIAVAVNHNGSDEEERKTGFLSLSDFCMWERPKDLTVVLDKMLKDPDFSQKIDASRIAAAGFSLGGSTAIWLAGAILTISELAKNEPEPPEALKASISTFIELLKTDSIVKKSALHSGDSFSDRRIKAVFALAPAIGQGFTDNGLSKINIPVQIVVGDADVIAPKDRDAGHYAKYIPSAKPLIILPGERGHYLTPASGTKHAEELMEVSLLAWTFFEEVFK